MKPAALGVLIVDAAGSEHDALLAALSKSKCVMDGSALVRKFDPLASAADSADGDLVLLVGVEKISAELQASDQRIRAALRSSGTNFHVLYGTPQSRLAQCLSLIEGACGTRSRSAAETSRNEKPWSWACDNCSDPLCEQHMLTRLLSAR